MSMKKLIISPIHSTQTYAKTQIELMDLPFVIASDFQTAGYGRYKRQWETPKGNFAATFVVKLQIIAEEFFKLPMLIGVKVCEVLTALANKKKFNLKWPNDILLNNQKVGGVLIEKQDDTFLIGIGLNLKHSPNVSSVIYPVTNIEDEINVSVRFKELLSKLALWFESLPKVLDEIDSETVIASYRKLLVGIGQNISVKTPHVAFEGVFKDISSNGSLILNVQGEERLIHAADIFLKE